MKFNGEPGGARTRDHRIKSAMLYQLSYRLDLLSKDGTNTAKKRPASSDYHSAPKNPPLL
jgi:hypothetical protein